MQRLDKPMRIVLTAILLVAGFACRLVALDPVGATPNWDEVRKAGRAKSQYLKDSKDPTQASNTVPTASLAPFRKTIESILVQKCVDCHGPKSSSAGLRIDKLNPDLLSGPDIDRWRKIFKVLANSEMPPEDQPKYHLSDRQRETIVDWLGEEIRKASIVRLTGSKHSSFRRMTKYEYNYALQDLFGISYPVANSLPPESASEEGFRNSSDLLQMSPMQFEAYREIGLKALKRATVVGNRPQPVTYLISMDELMKNAGGDKSRTFNRADKKYENIRNAPHFLNQKTGDGVHANGADAKPKPGTFAGHNPETSPVVFLLPGSNELKINLDRFLPDEGMMRVRIRAGRTSNRPQEFASLRLIFSAHTSNDAYFTQVVSTRDIPVTATADKPEIIEFDIPLSEIQRNPFRKLETTFPRRDEFIHIRNESNSRGGKEPLQVVIDYVEVSAPHFDQWPPKSHLDIFPASKNKGNEQAYGKEVLARFLERVWRRPVGEDELTPFLDLFLKYRPEFQSFEEAMVEVLATALATPEFLYLTQRSSTPDPLKNETINDRELASRLSFFLWSSVPDDELVKVARSGTLKNPNILKAQIERMLVDPRSGRFSQNFVEQWLGLEGLDGGANIKDEALRDAMKQEPVAFFREVLRGKGSIMDFIQSDYLVINERLARHYGIAGVYGPHFRKVPIASSTHRGGILTSAGTLAMNSEGADSHPLKRGVWVLKRILQDPPPPPPADVPKVDLTDPRILQMSLKERLADHRNKPACHSCHSRIDPWGIAFENFDNLGAWRTSVKNKPVDATSVLFNKQELAGVDGLKRYLLTDRQDQLAKAMVHKMVSYALGRPLTFGDQAELERLTAEFRKKGDTLRDLIDLIASSALFNSK